MFVFNKRNSKKLKLYINGSTAWSSLLSSLFVKCSEKFWIWEIYKMSRDEWVMRLQHKNSWIIKWWKHAIFYKVVFKCIKA